jgi:hypothetical protein
MNRMEALCGLGCKAVVVTALSLWCAAGAAQLLGDITQSITSPTATASTPSGQAAAVRSSALGQTTSLLQASREAESLGTLLPR